MKTYLSRGGETIHDWHGDICDFFSDLEGKKGDLRTHKDDFEGLGRFLVFLECFETVACRDVFVFCILHIIH